MAQPSIAKPRDVAMVAYEGFVDSVYDALLLFEAFSFNKVPRVTRRLTREERKYIRSGVVFIWDEEEAGILRWTDGRRWASSRPCGNFIVYDELDARTLREPFSMGVPIAVNPHGSHQPHHQPPHHPIMYSNKHNRNSNHMPGWSMGSVPSYSQGMHHTWQHTIQNNAMMPSRLHNTARNNYPVLRGELIKRALSINTADGRRMHLVSYYTAAEVEQKRLNIPRLDPQFEGIQIRKHLYPELICDTNLNGDTIWRFAKVQGRGRAYSTGTRGNKANSARSTSSPSSPELTKKTPELSEATVTTTEPSEKVEFNNNDEKKPEETTITEIVKKPVDENQPHKQFARFNRQFQNMNSGDFTAERMTPHSPMNQTMAHSSAMPEGSVSHALYGLRYSPYTDMKAARSHCEAPPARSHHWEDNCRCHDCNHQQHAPRTNPVLHAFHQPSPPILSRSPYLSERLPLTPNSTPSTAVSSRLSSMSVERSQSWQDQHSQWEHGLYSMSATPLTPHYSYCQLSSMAGSRSDVEWHYHPYDKSQLAPFYHGAGPCTDSHDQSCFYNTLARFPHSKPHSSTNDDYAPFPPSLPMQPRHPARRSPSTVHTTAWRSSHSPHIVRSESSSPSRMHPYRRPVNNHSSYDPPHGLSTLLHYGSRPVSSSVPLQSPPSASSLSSSSSYMVTESPTLPQYPAELSKLIISSGSTDIEMKHNNSIAPVPSIGYGKSLKYHC